MLICKPLTKEVTMNTIDGFQQSIRMRLLETLYKNKNINRATYNNAVTIMMKEGKELGKRREKNERKR